MPGERMGVGAKCQGNAWECKGMQRNTLRGGCNVPDECREIAWERMGLGVR